MANTSLYLLLLAVALVASSTTHAVPTLSTPPQGLAARLEALHASSSSAGGSDWSQLKGCSIPNPPTAADDPEPWLERSNQTYTHATSMSIPGSARLQSDATNNEQWVNTTSFKVDFVCNAGTADFCTRAQKAFISACNRIASEVKIRRPIVVGAIFFLPCGKSNPPASCAENNVLGAATSLQAIPVKHNDDGLVYMYPTSLLKQTDLMPDDESRVPMPDYDILAHFNSLSKYWFQGDPLPMDSKSRDLEYVLTHELMHGLGFGEDELMRNDAFGQETMNLLSPNWDSKPPSVMPPPSVLDLDESAQNNGSVFFSFSRPSIWNRFTLVQGLSLTSIASNLSAVVTSAIAQGSLSPISDTKLVTSAHATLDPKTNKTVTGATDPVYSPAGVLRVLSGSRAISVMSGLYSAGTRNGSLVFDPTVWPPSSNASTGATPATNGSTLATTRPMFLETTLNPYVAGSSLSHVQSTQNPNKFVDDAFDNDSVNPSPDFLMVWVARPHSIGEMIKKSGAPESGIGPGIKATLLAMGYTDAKSETWNSRKNHAAIVEAALRPVGWQTIKGYIGTPSAASPLIISWPSMLAAIASFAYALFIL